MPVTLLAELAHLKSEPRCNDHSEALHGNPSETAASNPAIQRLRVPGASSAPMGVPKAITDSRVGDLYPL
jgi:hypothetical protein